VDYIPLVLLAGLAGWHEYRFYRWVNRLAASRGRPIGDNGGGLYEDSPALGVLLLANAVCEVLLVLVVPSRGSWSSVGFYSILGISASAGWAIRLFVAGLRESGSREQ